MYDETGGERAIAYRDANDLTSGRLSCREYEGRSTPFAIVALDDGMVSSALDASPCAAMSSFADHFSTGAARYASYRPGYPPALFAWLATIVPDRDRAWDCGTGNGQAAAPLAAHFAHVVATDPSASQLTHATRHPRVSYAAMPAERSALATDSASLVTVAQALHWFDQAAFYAEARRVLVARGVLAIWSYGLLTLHDPVLDDIVHRFHRETVGPYWPPERRLVDEGYRAIDLPFERIEAPSFAMFADWTLEHFAGYLSTWSAVQRARADTGSDPVAGVLDLLRTRWGAAEQVRRVEWPLTLRIGRA
jgi:SAM-dependent methyltransferase